MLFIKFKVKNSANMISFQKLYEYMMKNHREDYTMKEYEDDIDLEERLQARALALYETYFPDYAQSYLTTYFEYVNNGEYLKEESVASLFSYLDIDFEVKFTDFKLENSEATIHFSALSYPYGGMDRFVQVIKAFGGIPVECYNGFEVFAYEWISEFDYDAKILPEKTQEYLRKQKNKF